MQGQSPRSFLEGPPRRHLRWRRCLVDAACRLAQVAFAAWHAGRGVPSSALRALRSTPSYTHTRPHAHIHAHRPHRIWAQPHQIRMLMTSGTKLPGRRRICCAGSGRQREKRRKKKEEKKKRGKRVGRNPSRSSPSSPWIKPSCRDQAE